MREGSERAGWDKADFREGRGRTLLGLHKIDLDVVGGAGLGEARGRVLGAFAQAIQLHGAIMGHEANLVVRVVGEDLPVLRLDHFEAKGKRKVESPYLALDRCNEL